MGARESGHGLAAMASKLTVLFTRRFCRPSTQGLPAADVTAADPRYVELTRGLKSAYLRSGHTAAQIDATLAQIDSYGCKVTAVAWNATAVPQRDSVLKIQYQVYWDDPAEDERHLAWIRGMYQAIYASTGGVPAPTADGNTDGCFVNYPDIDLSDNTFKSNWEWSTLYYKGNYPRLQRVKRRYDPLDVFRRAQSVKAS